MTEEEAKQRWCPFTRTARDADDFAANRDRDGAPIQNKHTCIASDCMAWRGGVTDDFIRRANTAFRRDGRQLKAEPSDIDGYCGLAGQPSGGAHV